MNARKRPIVSRAWGLTLAFAANLAFAQSDPQQLIKEAWVATGTDLFEVGAENGGLTLSGSAGPEGNRFAALAFEPPRLGETRHLIAADGTVLRFFKEDSSETIERRINLANGAPAPGFTTITSLAVTDDGTLLVSGYSKRRRWFELWGILPDGSFTDGPLAVDHPQLTDSVYLPADDLTDDWTHGPGLLAAAGRQVLFFPAAQSFGQIQVLLDVRNLPLKSNTSLLTVDLVRDTNALVVGTSTRQLLVTSPADTEIFPIPDVYGRNCASLKPQRLTLRVARGGTSGAVVYVVDGCGQGLRYEFDDPFETGLGTPVATPEDHTTGLVALAVGEGNTIVCESNDPCLLAPGFTTLLEQQAELFVLQYTLCDPRVAGAACEGEGDVSSDFVLSLNSRLPSGHEIVLGGETVTLPGDMYSWSADGSFGALIVAPTTPWDQGEVAAILTANPLVGSHLPVELDLPRGTPVQRLLNQAQVGYAPDGDEPASVGHWPDCDVGPCFQSTPVVVDAGSAVTRMRGYSVVTYGVMFDLRPNVPYASVGRVPERCEETAPDTFSPVGCTQVGGISPTQSLAGGSPPMCDLDYNSQVYTAVNDWKYYFVNMAACLFSDLETLLKSTDLIPDSAFGGTTNRNNLITRLGLAEDKLIKGLSTVGSSQGAQNLEAVFSQMESFDGLLDATTFSDAYRIYKNELGARSEAFQFNLEHRTIPSIPIGGIQ